MQLIDYDKSDALWKKKTKGNPSGHFEWPYCPPHWTKTMRLIVEPCKGNPVPSDDSSEEVTERVRRFLEKRSRFSSAVSLEIPVKLWPLRCRDSAGIFLPPTRDSLTFRFIIAPALLLVPSQCVSLQRRERQRDREARESVCSRCKGRQQVTELSFKLLRHRLTGTEREKGRESRF